MPVFILKFLQPLAPYLAAATVVLVMALYTEVLRHDVTAANDKNIALTQASQANLAAIAAYKTEQANWNSALDALDAQTLNTKTASGHIIDNISQAPATDDGSVAPVLSQALDGLRALQGNTP